MTAETPPPADSGDAAWAGALRGARDEALRLTALDQVAPGHDPEFEALAAEAAALFRAPVALVSMVDADHLWFKAMIGFAGGEVERSIAFCDRTIRSSDVLVVPDLAADPRFMDNPLVTGEAGLRFYAGAPVELQEGRRVGTVCVIDHAPRPEVPPQQRAALSRLAERAAALIRRQDAGLPPAGVET